MLYTTLFIALLLGGAASVPTAPDPQCSDGVCGGVCGDGIVQVPHEQCDLGPKLNGARNSGCSIDCMCLPVCGNGQVEAGEECDAGPRNGDYNSGCSTECKLCGYCGDGIVDHPEECDLGWRRNGSPGESCSANCTTVNTTSCVCGDGIVQPGEQCDDGAKNGEHGWRCGKDCRWADGCAKCGNGITEWPEECDDGTELNGTPSSHCASNCTLKKPCGQPHPPVCGNGIVEYPNEECDEGYMNGQPGSNCTTDCRRHKPCPNRGCNHNSTRCGDGKVDTSAGEECDDGEHNNGKEWSTCDARCKKKLIVHHCETCNPNPFFNKCTITTSCIVAPPGDGSRNYCACRAGYRANGLLPTDQRQFRLQFPGQEYRVFVAPGIECDTLCSSPHPGPESCQEVPVRADC